MTRPSRLAGLPLVWFFLLLTSHDESAASAVQAVAECSGQVIPSPNGGNGESVLLALAAVSTNDVWSAGLSYPTEGGEQPLIEHWNGTSWTVVPAPTLPTRHKINAIAAASPTNIWA